MSLKCNLGFLKFSLILIMTIIVDQRESIIRVPIPNQSHDEDDADVPITKFAFYFGSFLAFFSGLITTVNNFIIKETGSDFGELLAVRSLIQIPLMLGIAMYKGKAIQSKLMN